MGTPCDLVCVALVPPWLLRELRELVELLLMSSRLEGHSYLKGGSSLVPSSFTVTAHARVQADTPVLFWERECLSAPCMEQCLFASVPNAVPLVDGCSCCLVFVLSPGMIKAALRASGVTHGTVAEVLIP